MDRDWDFETLRDAVELVRLCRPVWELVGRRSSSLARQLQRAAESVPTNISEGTHRKGGHRTERFGTAYGSAREVKTILRVAEAAGYVPAPKVEQPWRLADSVCARLYRLGV